MRRLVFTLSVLTAFALPARGQKVEIQKLDVSQIIHLQAALNHFSVIEGSEPVTQAGTRQLMVLSADKTHLVNTMTNKPVFMNGDAAWSAIVQLNDADAAKYLSDRSKRGFNIVLVNLLEHVWANNCSSCSHGCADIKGDCPFTGETFSTPNEAYFAQADSFLRLASKHGITVLLDLFDLQPQPGDGWDAEIQAASDATMTNWGTYVGNRYREFDNVIYTIGTDEDPRRLKPPLTPKLNEMATALHAADPNHLITSKNGGDESSLDVWSGHPWLGISEMYGAKNVTKLNKEYTRPDFIPFFMDEDTYENEHSSMPLLLRTRQYWSSLSGAYLGSFFGNSPIWCFNETTRPAGIPCRNDLTWQSQLGSEGSVGQMWYGKLMRSREHWKMVPDIKHTVVTAGYGSGATLTVTARTRDGQTIISYIPNGNATTLTVDMSKITSKTRTAECWWFNPSDGATKLIGSFANSGMRHFTPPDAKDWLLIIDDKNADLPPPGTSDL
jgi:hypothetical protein